MISRSRGGQGGVEENKQEKRRIRSVEEDK